MLKRYAILLLLLFLARHIFPQDTAHSGESTLKVLCINDMHGAIDNMPKLAFIVDSIRALHPDALLLAAGDSRTGNPFNDKCAVPNKPMIDLMNLIGFDMATMGNHECDGGIGAFIRNIDDSFFPYIVANAHPADSLHMRLAPFRLFKRSGVTVAILGLVQINAEGIPDCHPHCVEGVRFTDPFAEADNYRWLRDRSDVYIGLTHLGIEQDTILADLHPEFDLLVCGHSHDLIPGTTRNGVMMAQAGRDVKFLNEVDITVKQGVVTDKKCKTISVNAASGINPKAQAMVDAYNAAAQYRKVLAVAEGPFHNAEQLGSMMADGIRSTAGADFAIVNAGSVRYHRKDSGDITVGDILRLDPFDNELMVAHLSGRQVARAIAEIAESDGYGPPFVSGLCYEISMATPPSVCLHLPQGTPIDPDSTYSVAINSYIAAITPTIKEANIRNTFNVTADALMKYLLLKKTVDYSRTRRIRILRPTTPTTPTTPTESER